MDRLNLISAGLFLLANIFGITSVALPDWLITEIERSPSGKFYDLQVRLVLALYNIKMWRNLYYYTMLQSIVPAYLIRYLF